MWNLNSLLQLKHIWKAEAWRKVIFGWGYGTVKEVDSLPPKIFGIFLYGKFLMLRFKGLRPELFFATSKKRKPLYNRLSSLEQKVIQHYTCLLETKARKGNPPKQLLSCLLPTWCVCTTVKKGDSSTGIERGRGLLRWNGVWKNFKDTLKQTVEILLEIEVFWGLKMMAQNEKYCFFTILKYIMNSGYG